MRASSTLRLAISVLILVSTMTFPLSSAHAAVQKVSFYINGDCSDYYDLEDEYAFFEDETDWTCLVSIKVLPSKPVRTARLQYWSGKKWKQDTITKTNSKGVGYLEFNQYCGDAYCDGTWKYRVLVDSVTGQPSRTSPNFEVSFYPVGYDDDSDEDEDS